MNDSVNGWTPPLFYDVSTDTKRIATQADIDWMQKKISWLGRFYADTRRAADELHRVFSEEHE